MKTILIVFLLILCRLLETVAQEKKLYSYFVPQTKTADSDNHIEVNQKGDTVLVAHYRAIDALNKTNNEFTKVYKGTPFFMNGWYKGFVEEKNGHQSEFVMAYNIQKGLVYLVTDPLMEATQMRPPLFSMKQHTFKLFKNEYFEPIYEGKTVILKEYQCMLKSNRPTQRTGYETEGGESEYEGEFVKSVKYYLQNGDVLKAIPIGKRIFKLFGNQAKMVEAYAQSNRLNPEKEAELIAIFKYFDAL
jgi:hypothetical protein